MEPTTFTRQASRLAIALLLMASYFVCCLSAPVKEKTAHPCLMASDCDSDPEAVYSIYKNETYCCHGGNAIIHSVSGLGFMSSAYYYQASRFSTNDGDGDRSKRSAATDGENKNPSNDTNKPSESLIAYNYTCMCKPVNAEDFAINFRGWNFDDSSSNSSNSDISNILGDLDNFFQTAQDTLRELL